MSGAWRFFQRLIGKTTEHAAPKAFAPDVSKFAVGDRILIDGVRLTAPLRPNNKHDLPSGFVNHNDIIGRPATRSKVHTNTGASYEIKLPDLDQYVSLTPRKVTPVYANYASLIVTLLDFHVPPPTAQNLPSTNTPPLEILESGTGHGSLTLHLARAITAANPPPPSGVSEHSLYEADWAVWRASRRAVLHSVEINSIYQAHAEKIVRAFRQGLYWPHVDFHTDDVGSWTNQQLEKRNQEPFLTHVVLDMPGVHKRIGKVVTAMKEDATLALFVPSVTQIGDCVREIEKNAIPLRLEKAVEVGEGISNGRIWDVRLVQPRNTAGPSYASDKSQAGEEEVVNTEKEVRGNLQESDEPVMVCRPMVGNMTIGGGFVGLWRKVTDFNETKLGVRREKRSKRRR